MKFKLPILGVLMAAIVIAADQISKLWVLDQFKDYVGKGTPAKHMTDYFDLVLVWNRGVSFGIFNHDTTVMPAVLMGLALILVAFVTRWLFRAETWGEALAFGLIIGGAIGNVVDRARLGAVVDFLDFHWAERHWPAFNVADSAIVLGACLILYLWGTGGKTSV